jgi:pantothenate kinase
MGDLAFLNLHKHTQQNITWFTIVTKKLEQVLLQFIMMSTNFKNKCLTEITLASGI